MIIGEFQQQAYRINLVNIVKQSHFSYIMATIINTWFTLLDNQCLVWFRQQNHLVLAKVKENLAIH